MLSLRNTLLTRLVGLFLLVLLALKTAGLLFSVCPEQRAMYLHVPTDVDNAESDDMQDIKNATGTLVCLIADHQISVAMFGFSVEKVTTRKHILFVNEHFNVIPSPPPDVVTI
ncbi:hypothetical protein [Sphingobacterium griseoflavum]|uniref:Uncharacterized protein n=1 Tax=Sphingobacterium griseoflavum TaxID=1474952 RepID=A0ABQ3HZQ3_9SPHI|nr:hypothetical protein [Sphingobacterium griseoflavum]GHE41882.1 hypothetical protein GCM10017764_26380 [Sphingobacterium griseoflavum]